MTDWLTWVPRPIDDAAYARLREVGDVALGVPWEEVAGRVDAVLLRSARMDRARIEAAPRLRIIARHGAGYDTVDLAAARERGVAVTVTADANAVSVAEHAFALVLAVVRRVATADAAVRAGRWDEARRAAVGLELDGKVLGLVGFGKIGRRVARMAAAFDMTVLATDPAADAGAARELDVRLVPLPELLAASDVVSLHVPLLPATCGLIDARALAGVRPGAVLVNTSRGGLVDEAALADALDRGLLSGAGLDVFDEEPLAAGSPLLRADVTLTPHCGGQTVEAMRRVGLQAADSVVACARGLPPDQRSLIA
ncbi:hydroxyacid dehydrogenase [Pseudonocardia adelaidensis]|uniref:Hydroxyacid dehydrogenase n=1 Tax=Pseudonocardia adelaidensis TaxID=648754 RepID=A0ABP9NXR3_9PSEU